MHDLAKVLGRKGHHLDIAKSLEAVKKKKVKVLEKPLEKPVADRVRCSFIFMSQRKNYNVTWFHTNIINIV